MTATLLRPIAVDESVGIEDLRSVLNPVKATDLRMMLTVIPAYDRPRMALAFVNLTYTQWGAAAGIPNPQQNVWRWLVDRGTKLPFGAAARLAKVLGVPMDELFQDWM